MVSWLKRHPTLVNLVLPFLIALASGIWAGLFVYRLTAEPAWEMSPAWHLLLVAATALLVLQAYYNHNRESPDRRVIEDILELGNRFLAEHADSGVQLSKLRSMVHLCKRTRPGASLPMQRCLVPCYWRSPVKPRDAGAIPIDRKSFGDWYVNVQAFHQQRIVCSEPDLDRRPNPDGFHVSTPSLFDARSVIATPIWSWLEPPSVIGTLTFDSVHSLEELGWMDGSEVDEAVSDMMTSAAELIGRILTRHTREG